MYRILVVLLLLAAFPVMNAAQDDDQIVITGFQLPDSLLPDYAVTASAGYVLTNVYNTLMTTSDAGELVGDLAESWEVSEDGLTWAINLRQDVLWHDGEPFTAEDVKYTFEVSADPGYTGALFDPALEGAQAKQSGEADEVSGVQIVDDYTVTLTTVEPNALLPQLGAFGQRYILPEHVLSEIAAADLPTSQYAEIPIGTGPYQVVEVIPDSTLRMEAFADYYGGAANIETVIIQEIPDPSVAYSELVNGNVNVLTQISADDFDFLQEEAGVQTLQIPGVNITTILINTQSPYLSNAAVRQALSYSIDRASIVAAVGGGFGGGASSILHPNSAEYNDALEPYAYDPETAAQLLEDAGWRDEDGDGIRESYGIDGLEDGTPFRMEFGTWGADAYALPAQIIQQNWGDIGVATDLNVLDFNIYFSEYVGVNNEAFRVGMSGWFNFLSPPQDELASNFTSTGANNFFHGWSNERVDELIAEAPTVFDEAERNALYAEVQAILYDELPWIYLTRLDNLIAFSANLDVPDVASLTDFYNVMPQWSLN